MKTEMWICPKCSEAIDDGFVVCWQCGTNQNGKEDPAFPSQAEDDEAMTLESRPQPFPWQLPLSKLLIVVSCVGILLGAFRVFPSITTLAIYGGIIGNIFGLALALIVTYVLRIPNDGSLSWKDKDEQDAGS